MDNNLKKILENLKHKKFSLVNIYPEDVFEYESFTKTFKKNLQNSVVVQDEKKFNILNHQFNLISPDLFQDKKTEFYEKTKNGVVIWHFDFDDLEGLQAYYPIIFVKNIEDNNLFVTEFEKDLGDWKTVYLQDKKTMILINKNIKNFDNFVFEDFVLSAKEIIKENIKPVFKLKPDNFINYDIFNSLPKPNIFPPDKNNVKWCQEFYTYILEILKVIVPVEKERYIPYIINKQNFKSIWLKAFTHFTAEPDISENYESLEAVGDKVLKLSFNEYYFNKYPYANAGELKDATEKTQSDEAQSELGIKMGFKNWVITEEILRNNMKLSEDLLESFAGAVDTALYQAGIIGASVVIFNNMFKRLYGEYDLQSKLNSITFLNQIIEQIAPKDINLAVEMSDEKKLISLNRPKIIDPKTFNKIIEQANIILKEKNDDYIFTSEKLEKKKDPGIEWDDYVTRDNKIRVDVRVNEYGAKVLKSYGFNIKKNQIIGTATESTIKPAKRHASDNARDFLESKGITKKWIDNQVFKKRMSDLEGLEEKVLLKAKNIHKDIIMLGVDKKELKKDKIFVLYGENKKGYKYPLETYVSEGEPTNNFLILAQKFLD